VGCFEQPAKLSPDNPFGYRTGEYKMRYGLVVLWMLLCWVNPAAAQISIGIGLPSVSIGINLGSYPELIPVPGYPVYYAPRLGSNFFFYDGMYWVYEEDNWYASSWYNGPWGLVAPEFVPLYVLRVPVRYYRHPPAYFRGWRSDAPPRWGEHWGRDWEQHRRGWDKWDRNSAPRPAPLPVYQRNYSGDRYPRVEQQRTLQSQNYRYQPRDAVVRQHYQEQGVQRAPAPSQPRTQAAPQERSPRQQDTQQRSNAPPAQQGAPAVQRSQPQQQRKEEVQRQAPTSAPPQQRGPAVQDQRPQPQHEAAPRAPQTPRSQAQDKGPPGKGVAQEPKNEPKRAQKPVPEKDSEKGPEKGKGRE
jgi:hypothetical protein